MKKFKEKEFDIFYTDDKEKKLYLLKDQCFRFTGTEYFILIQNIYTIRKLKENFKFISNEPIYKIAIYAIYLLQNEEISKIRAWKDQEFFLYRKQFNRLRDFLKVKKIIDLPRIEVSKF